VRPVAATLLVVYSALVSVIVAWPSPVDAGSRELLIRILSALHRRGLPGFIDYSLVEFGANVAMFVPLGLLIALLLGPRIWWLAILVCVGLSVSIELYQLVALPARFATVRDVLANSTGGALGAAIAAMVIARTRRPRLPDYPGGGGASSSSGPADIRI
jgi:glycopeptide antibiotics resistance protein